MKIKKCFVLNQSFVANRFENNSYDKLRETGTTHWPIPDTSVTNKSGFTALPGGFFSNQPMFGMETNFHFGDIGLYGFWWSSTEDASLYPWSYWISLICHRSMNPKGYGLAVRCVKDI